MNKKAISLLAVVWVAAPGVVRAAEKNFGATHNVNTGTPKPNTTNTGTTNMGTTNVIIGTSTTGASQIPTGGAVGTDPRARQRPPGTLETRDAAGSPPSKVPGSPLYPVTPTDPTTPPPPVAPVPTPAAK